VYVREVFTSLRNNNNKNGAQAIGRKTCSCLLQDINQRAIFLISSGTFTLQTGSSSSSTDLFSGWIVCTPVLVFVSFKIQKRGTKQQNRTEKVVGFTKKKSCSPLA
jgi:hypothetical protein